MGAATGELDGFARQIVHDHPEMAPRDSFQIKVETLNDMLLGQFKGTLFLLFGAASLLLLIGCGNVSILMLAPRDSDRTSKQESARPNRAGPKMKTTQK
jgi:hypothetical protein